jgi:hypothetical protein
VEAGMFIELQNLQFSWLRFWLEQDCAHWRLVGLQQKLPHVFVENKNYENGPGGEDSYQANHCQLRISGGHLSFGKDHIDSHDQEQLEIRPEPLKNQRKTVWTLPVTIWDSHLLLSAVNLVKSWSLTLLVKDDILQPATRRQRTSTITTLIKNAINVKIKLSSDFLKMWIANKKAQADKTT